METHFICIPIKWPNSMSIFIQNINQQKLYESDIFQIITFLSAVLQDIISILNNGIWTRKSTLMATKCRATLYFNSSLGTLMTQHKPCIWMGTAVKCNPDSKVHGANIGPTWVLSAADGPHVGPMNLAIREVTMWFETFSCPNKLNHITPSYFLG